MPASKVRSAFPSGIRENVTWVLVLLAIIWGLAFFNWILGYQLNSWGLYPRTARGIAGIALSPFLHHGFGHVLANTIPLFVLGSLVAVRGAHEFLEATLVIAVAGGLGVWIMARPAYHIGASGLIMGYFGFLLARGWYDRSLASAATALLVLLLYGGLLWSVIPGAAWMSWEMHLFGFLAGVLAARVL
jgi:membrane associated rhomboid family serine protease